jgi:hypothetical protein
MTPANLIQIGLNHRRIQNGSLRKGNLPGRIWHGLGGDSLGIMAVEKNDVDQKRSVGCNATNNDAQTMCQTHQFGQRTGYKCMYLPFYMKK